MGTVHVPDDLHEEMKAHCKITGRTHTQVVTDAMELYFQERAAYEETHAGLRKKKLGKVIEITPPG